MKAFVRTLAQGVLATGVGLVCFATGGAAIPLVGTVLISSGIYCGAKASIRGIRELVDEHDV